MFFKTRVIKYILPMLCALLLSLGVHAFNAEEPISTAAAQPLVSPFTMPVMTYLALAKNHTGREQQSLLILAAGRLIYDGQWREGRTILSQTSDLPGDLDNEKRILLAKIDLIRAQPKAAIVTLATVYDLNQLSLFYQVQHHDLN